MKDFTLKTYRHLLNSLIKAGYVFQRFEDFIENPKDKVVILRHDIDTRPKKALEFAQIERELDIKSTYYFRIVKKTYCPKIIKSIVSDGHELGYHYEDLSNKMGNYQKAILSFEENLNLFRQFYPIRTISMHGRAMSVYDNRDLWKKFNYKDFGLFAEPYIDVDFNNVLYLSDSGQCWNGGKATLRDKVDSGFQFSFGTTFDIIQNISVLPDRIMITVHPDRWAADSTERLWLAGLIWLRNTVKILIFNRLARMYNRRKGEKTR